ncbi:hypothetical protein F5877DRAFT_84682 [Lentinula edodes]|nr:hypothetical protein F5877DRAFT_84682 [Lentinula edodes]
MEKIQIHIIQEINDNARIMYENRAAGTWNVNKAIEFLSGQHLQDNEAWGEVKVLKHLDLYVDLEMITVDNQRKPGVLMMKMDGVVIFETKAYSLAPWEERLGYLKTVKNLVEKEAVRRAVKDQILHADFSFYNILVGGTKYDTGGDTLDLPITKIGLPDRILGFYGDDTYLDEADKKVFEKNLDLVVGSHRDECSGAYNKGIYTLLKDYEVGGVNHGKDTVIVKVIGGVGNPESTVDNKVWGEVKALKDVDLYIDSGMAKVGDGKYPVIVMKLVEGVMIKETNEYLDAKVDQRTKWLEEAKAHVKKEVVQNAVQKGVLHTDLNSYNFVVGGADTSDGPTLAIPITEARLVDWGYPGVFKVKNGVTEDEVKKWFELQWKKKIKA